MSLRRILVDLSPTGHSHAHREVALALAAAHGAKAVGYYRVPNPSLAVAYHGAVPVELFDTLVRRAFEGAAAAESAFVAAAGNAGVTPAWYRAEGGEDWPLEVYARYADLVVVRQSEPDAPIDRDAPGVLAIAAGRPVLVVPYIGGGESLGRRVLVAWDGSREAARAVHDALPILRRSESVVVYCANPVPGDYLPGADIAAHLAEHGVAAEAHETASRLDPNETAVVGARSVPAGDLLLSAAADMAADLMVMGAYGHARLRELVLGGVTRHVLEHMTLPVLLAH